MCVQWIGWLPYILCVFCCTGTVLVSCCYRLRYINLDNYVRVPHTTEFFLKYYWKGCFIWDLRTLIDLYVEKSLPFLPIYKYIFKNKNWNYSRRSSHPPGIEKNREKRENERTIRSKISVYIIVFRSESNRCLYVNVYIR